jgi:hypothetical protein
MPFSYREAVDQMLIPALAMIFLVGSLVGAATGAGLIVSGARVLRLFGFMNRYVSTRSGLKAMSMPHDIGPLVRRHRHLIGACLVLGAGYSVYGLLAWFDSDAFAAALDLRYPRSFVAWLLNGARWTLIAYGVLGILAGLMLGFFPRALDRIEARANRWYSIRKFTLGGDTMHLTLDRFVEAFPRSTGALIVIGALYVAVNAAMLWLRFR